MQVNLRLLRRATASPRRRGRATRAWRLLPHPTARGTGLPSSTSTVTATRLTLQWARGTLPRRPLMSSSRVGCATTSSRWRTQRLCARAATVRQRDLGTRCLCRLVSTWLRMFCHLEAPWEHKHVAGPFWKRRGVWSGRHPHTPRGSAVEASWPSKRLKPLSLSTAQNPPSLWPPVGPSVPLYNA